MRTWSRVLAAAVVAGTLLWPSSATARTQGGIDPALRLAVSEMGLARDTGDPRHYDRAEAAVEGVLRREPSDYEALRLRGWVQSGRHEFEAALRSARKASAIRPDDAWNLGVMTDALVELGRYDEAVETAQRMVDLRPSQAAYSRISYLRWLHGDLDGAERAMKLAIEAGQPGSAETAWCSVQLGDRYFDRGRSDDADRVYRQVLGWRSGYAPALGGLAKVAAARGDYDRAVTLYREAAKASPLRAYRIGLADAMAAKGDLAGERREREAIERDLREHMSDPETRLLASAYWSDRALHPDKALRYAEADVRGADDIQAWDAVAWARYRDGRFAQAAEASERALRLGTKDARLLYHAGMIAAAQGREHKARELLGQALELNPYFDRRGAAEAKRTLRTLRIVDRGAGKGTDWGLALGVSLLIGATTAWSLRPEKVLGRRRSRSVLLRQR